MRASSSNSDAADDARPRPLPSRRRRPVVALVVALALMLTVVAAVFAGITASARARRANEERGEEVEGTPRSDPWSSSAGANGSVPVVASSSRPSVGPPRASASPTATPTGEPTEGPTASASSRPTELAAEDPAQFAAASSPFVFGELEAHPALGLYVASGLTVRVIAQSGKRVKFTSNSTRGGRASSGRCKFHVRPDGAAAFPYAYDDAAATAAAAGELGEMDIEDVGGTGGIGSPGDWLYCSNSEVKEYQKSATNRCEGLMDGTCRAGVYCLHLDAFGHVKDYVHRLGGDETCGFNDGVGPDLPSTSTNCQGGRTPWGTYVSCEETGDGHCWQVDPMGRRAPRRIEALGTTKPGEDVGGWEAMAWMDHRRGEEGDAAAGSVVSCPTFYFTEDRVDGKVRRLRPDCATSSNNSQGLGWDALHAGNVTVDYLEFVGGCGGGSAGGGAFRWTRDASAAERSARECYPYAEGIATGVGADGPSSGGGRVYFVTKDLDVLFALDHDDDGSSDGGDGGNNGTGNADGGRWHADRTHTNDLLEGEGNFALWPDQITTNDDGGGGAIMYHTTDGSSTPGVYVHNLKTGKYYTLWQSFELGEGEEESVGHAISPDGRFAVGALQKDGRVFLMSRKDGGTFRGVLDLRLRRRRRRLGRAGGLS